MPEHEVLYRIVVKANDKASLLGMIKDHNISIGGGGPQSLPDGTFSMEAYVPAQTLEQLKNVDAYTLEVIEDAIKVGKERQKEVGVGDRFSEGKEVPLGLGVQREKKP
jgi:hypothetical protein